MFDFSMSTFAIMGCSLACLMAYWIVQDCFPGLYRWWFGRDRDDISYWSKNWEHRKKSFWLWVGVSIIMLFRFIGFMIRVVILTAAFFSIVFIIILIIGAALSAAAEEEKRVQKEAKRAAKLPPSPPPPPRPLPPPAPVVYHQPSSSSYDDNTYDDDSSSQEDSQASSHDEDNGNDTSDHDDDESVIVNMDKLDACEDCDGTSWNDLGDGKCSTCHGSGYEGAVDQFVDGVTGEDDQSCSACNGSGVCQSCSGKGFHSHYS